MKSIKINIIIKIIMDIAQRIIDINGLKFKINISLCSPRDEVEDLIKFGEVVPEVVIEAAAIPEDILIDFNDVPEVVIEANQIDKKSNSQKYYQANKAKINEYSRQYRDANREHINEKFNCPCGGRYTRTAMSHHFKSKKHLKYLELTQTK